VMRDDGFQECNHASWQSPSQEIRNHERLRVRSTSDIRHTRPSCRAGSATAGRGSGLVSTNGAQRNEPRDGRAIPGD
jgi:hypothetical protein